MSSLVVNCRSLPFTSTLGVAHSLLQLCAALAAEHEITFVVDRPGDVLDGPVADTIRGISADVTDPQTARSRDLGSSIELLPHHFQPPEFCERSVVTCYDLHVFDIPWKYGDRAASMQQKLRRVLTSATAVVTPFPRTYYVVEQTAGITLMHLFLTDSPLLFDTRPARTSVERDPTRRRTLLYPAQLQEHKNHVALISSLARLRDSGREVDVLCPGSDFSDAFTAQLRSLAVEEGVDECVRFLGRVSDDELLDLYRTADGLIVPSLAEGGAYVALEAIAAGLPVAVNRIESAEMHAMAMGAHVIWFDAADQGDVDRAVAEVMDADLEQSRVANADCVARIEAATWDRVAAQYGSVFELVEGRRDRLNTLLDDDASNIVLA